MLHRILSLGAVALFGATSFATRAPHASGSRAAFVRDSVAEERVYVTAVATIADGAIHRLDFFPARAQLRVQSAFLTPTPDGAVAFDALATHSGETAMDIDAAVERLSAVVVPRDLKPLNTQLVKALKDATRATASLTTAARACQMAMSSVDRCQVPFSAASSRMTESYKHYLEARAKIRAQVLDTDTHLDDFKSAR